MATDKFSEIRRKAFLFGFMLVSQDIRFYYFEKGNMVLTVEKSTLNVAVSVPSEPEYIGVNSFLYKYRDFLGLRDIKSEAIAVTKIIPEGF